jgi:hypothetical protein
VTSIDLGMPVTGPSTPAERARQLVLRHGWNTTAYQVLNPGFHHWFSGDGEGVIGYVPRSSVWVVGGAPACAIANEERIGLRTMLGVAEAVVGGDLIRFGAQTLRTEVRRMTTGAP